MAEAGRERRTCTVRPELGRCGGTGVGSLLSMELSCMEPSCSPARNPPALTLGRSSTGENPNPNRFWASLSAGVASPSSISLGALSKALRAYTSAEYRPKLLERVSCRRTRGGGDRRQKTL
eukprot:scaffold92699_cov60-Phaeocystis_antarctica.AAC.4